RAATAGVTIPPVSANSRGVTLNVTLSCVHANPAIATSPSSQSSSAGAPSTYSVSVTNTDEIGCGPSSFNLQAAVPAGWNATFAASALTLNPATSASTTLTVTSAGSAAINSYTVAVTATNSGYTGTATATYSIVPGLSLSTVVSTDKLIYAAGDSVTNTDVTTQGGNPVANASVTFTITKPNGAVVTQNTRTDSNGKAAYKLKLS